MNKPCKFAQVPECEVLKRLWKKGLMPCEKHCSGKPRFPSYVYVAEKKWEGCLIAHSVLTLLEYIKMRRRLPKRILSKFNKGEDIILQAFHDFAKLSKQYRCGRLSQHNVASAIIVSNIIKSITNNRRNAYICGLACFFHHEPRHWRVMDVDFLALDIFNTIRNTEVAFEEDDIKFYLDCMAEWFHALGFQNLAQEVKNLPLSVFKLNYNLRLHIKKMRNNLGKQLSDFKYAMVLYRYLFFADNRAASAREGSEKYLIGKLRASTSGVVSYAKVLDTVRRERAANEVIYLSLLD